MHINNISKEALVSTSPIVIRDINSTLSKFGFSIFSPGVQLDHSEQALANRIGDTAYISSIVTAKLRDNGLTVEILPCGMWRKASGYTGLAICVSVFSLLLLAYLGLVTYSHWIREGALSWVPVMVIVLVVATNTLLWWLAHCAGSRCAIIETIDDEISIVYQGNLQKFHRTWKSDELQRIVHAFAGYTINEKPVTELWFETSDKERFKCLTHLTWMELDGIARLLTEWLGSGTPDYEYRHQDPNLKYAVTSTPICIAWKHSQC